MFLKKLFTPQSISVVFTLQTIKVREEEKQEMGDTMRERETDTLSHSCNEPILRKVENRREGPWPGLNQIVLHLQ